MKSFASVLAPALTSRPPLAGTIRRDVLAPYVEVRKGGRCTGSGVAIRAGGELLVLTAHHVVADGLGRKSTRYAAPSDAFELVKHNSGKQRTWTARVVYFSPAEGDGPGVDLALLRPGKPEGLTPARSDFGARLEEGEDAWYVGTPRGLHRSLEKSIINRTDYRALRQAWVIVNGHGTFGNSGGPLFVRRGNDYVLVSVAARVVGGSSFPKTPLMFKHPRTVGAFLDAYRKDRERDA